MLWHVFYKKNNANVCWMEVLNVTLLGWELQGIKESAHGIGTCAK